MMEKPMNSPPPYDSGYTNATYNHPYPPNPMNTPNYAPVLSAPVTMQPTTTTHQVNVVVGGGAVAGSCPVCHNKNWTGTYSLCAWLFCIFCFPCGVICCCCMRKKKCTKCGFTVG